jgi:tetratricopeptide (TPR) repeat protein
MSMKILRRHPASMSSMDNPGSARGFAKPAKLRAPPEAEAMPRPLFAVLLALSLAGPAVAVGPDFSDLNGNPAYERARVLIKEGEYARAIPLLAALKREFQAAADIPSWLGFCHRKLKDYPTAKTFYDEALTLNPTHLGANEYLGEWYAETGNLPKAKEQLAYLKGLCGACEEANDLAEAIEKAEKAK